MSRHVPRDMVARMLAYLLVLLLVYLLVQMLVLIGLAGGILSKRRMG